MKIEEITTLIKEEKYQQALDEIKKVLESNKLDLEKDEDYAVYKGLLSLRVTANTLKGELDDIVSSTARKERFPYKSEIDFGNGDIVKLWEKDIFQIKCDALINTIHENKFFDYNEKSFSKVFAEHLKDDEPQNQIKSQFSKSKDYYIIHHQQLNAKQSYHIPAIWDVSNLDLQVLQSGLREVFEDVRESKLSRIAMVALAAEAEISEPDKVVEIIADEINAFFEKLTSDYNPEIIISFVNYESLRRYEKILHAKTMKGRYILREQKDLNVAEKEIIDSAKTNDVGYVKQLRKLAIHLNEDSTVLLTGETGVGKSYLAKHIIHGLSNKPKDSFIQVNCAAISSNLIQSKIFGAVKGSYTGAYKDTRSIFEVAKGGTVFLDEIGYANWETQLSLLRALNEKDYYKVGDSEKLYKVECRIVLGTDNQLEDLVRDGKFHEPLYDRMANQIKIHIPPLKDRINDIDIIINDELEKLNHEKNSEIEIENDAKDLLKNYPWPGNYRQIHNNIDRWFKESFSQGHLKITKNQIKEDPPRTTTLKKGNLAKLESIIEEYLRNWDFQKNGKFREEFINPLLAKVYLENLSDQYNKTESNKVLGIDGERSNSKIEQLLNRYNEVIRDKIE